MTNWQAILEVDTLTEKQRETVELLAKGLSKKEVADRLGCIRSTVQCAARMAIKKAALAGIGAHFQSGSPDVVIPNPLEIKGTSTLKRLADGSIQWVKTSVNQDRREEMIREVADGLSETIERVPPLPAPEACISSLANVYTLTDCHIGMMAWHEEGGQDWDLKIAEKTITGCFEQMVLSCPIAETGIVVNLGDWLHYDGLSAVTPTSGHYLDSDGRFGKMVRVSIRVLRRIIDCALLKHKNVILLIAEGNHDLASSVWMRHMFAALYENEPRLTVIQRESPYYAHKHGETMLFWHHGHMKKPDQLPLMAAAEFPAIWGTTKKRYGHVGDKHHVQEREHSGIIIRQHPTLAARDAYASRHGWHALRAASGITYHVTHGEVARHTVCPEMLE